MIARLGKHERRTLLLFLLIITIVTTIASSAIYRYEQDERIRDTTLYAEREIELVSKLITEALIKNDYVTVKQFISHWAQERPDLVKAKLTTANGFVLAQHLRAQPTQYPLSLSRQLYYGGRGVVNMDMVWDVAPIYHKLDRLLTMLVAIPLVLVITLLLFLWWVLHRTLLKPLHNKLEVSEQYNRMLFEQSPIGLMLCRMNGELVDINHAFARIIGRSVEETLQLTYWAITPESYAADEQRLLESLKKTGRYDSHEKEYIHKDGHRVPVRLQGLLLEKGGEQLILSSVEDITERRRTEEAIRNITIGVSAKTGEQFFQSLTVHLAKLFGTKYTFIGLLNLQKPDIIDTVALCIHGEITDNVGYGLLNTPCEHVVNGSYDSIQAYPRNIQQLFPEDLLLVEMGVHSYVGVPLVDASNSPIGVIVVMDDKPMENTNQVGTMLQLFATRAAAELERLRSEEALQQSRQRLADAQQMAHIGSWELNLTTNQLLWSDEIYRIFEIDPQKFSASYKRFLEIIHPDDREQVNTAYMESVENKTPYRIDHRIQISDGTTKHVQERGKTFYDAEGHPVRSVGTVQDVTERVSMEEALRRSQKMDAIGQLSGGIAHDFNNQLGVVIGYLDFLRNHLSGDEKPRQWVDIAIKSTLRCMDLTRQLLTFSRHQAKDKSVVDLNVTLNELETMIARSVTPEVEVQYFLTNKLWQTEIDPGEFQDVILNLVINARDAMPGGGKLLIETSNKYLDAGYIACNPGVAPGDYVQLMLSDTGSGMDKETMEHIFEPFFTTKPKGKGTGLGMAMVYGFAKRYGGNIKVYSEPGVGTTVRLYLPRTKVSKSAAAIENIHEAELPTGSETILIVDDEVDLLQLAGHYLSALGYQTHLAGNTQQALAILERDEQIDLLFSDVVMPGGMNGYELAQQATQQRPGLKVLLTSGFTSKTIAHNGLARFSAHLLSKPYRKADLARQIRIVLDEKIVE